MIGVPSKSKLDSKIFKNEKTRLKDISARGWASSSSHIPLELLYHQKDGNLIKDYIEIRNCWKETETDKVIRLYMLF